MLRHEHDNLIYTPPESDNISAYVWLVLFFVFFVGGGTFIGFESLPLTELVDVLFLIGGICMVLLGFYLTYHLLADREVVVGRDGSFSVNKTWGSRRIQTHVHRFEIGPSTAVVLLARHDTFNSYDVMIVQDEQHSSFPIRVKKLAHARQFAAALSTHLGIALRIHYADLVHVFSAQEGEVPLIQRLPMPANAPPVHTLSKTVTVEQKGDALRVQIGPSGFNPTTIFITLTGLAFVGLAALILVGDLLEFGPPESISVLIIPLLSAAGGLIFMVNGLGIALGLKANLTLTPKGLTIHRNAFGMSAKEHFIPLDDLYEVDTMRSTFRNGAGQYSAWGKHLRICSSDKSYDLGYYYPLAELEHARDTILNHLRMQVSSNDYSAPDQPTASTNPPR